MTKIDGRKNGNKIGAAVSGDQKVSIYAGEKFHSSIDADWEWVRDKICKFGRLVANIVEIVVLSSSANTFLRVGSALHFSLVRSRINLSQEDSLELVHTGVCELQSGIVVRHHRAGWHECVCIFILKKVNKGLTGLGGGPLLFHGGQEATEKNKAAIVKQATITTAKGSLVHY
jgi:hypothetical protein